MGWSTTLLAIFLVSSPCLSSEIFMITMGGTKSHKIPFWELARGLIARNHSVTFVSAFPADFHMDGLEEITPAGLVFYVRNYTNWDLVGAKMRGEEPLPFGDVIRYAYESCEAFLDDHETRELVRAHGRARRRYDLMILDGAFPECAFGLVHAFGSPPFMYVNTVAFYAGSIARAGSPQPWSVTPMFARPHTDAMPFGERLANAAWHATLVATHAFTMRRVQRVLERALGERVVREHVYDTAKNVSFVLQNGHHSVTYPRPYLPNVAEIACIHCRPARPLEKTLEDFINLGGDSGFVFVSMGSSVKTSNMPEELRRVFIRTFARLPYQVLWKWEDDSREMSDLPSNVMLSKWLPQQDLLGHRKIRAFVTHGGLLSMFETVYHGVPVVTMPVFCDHESNAAKAVLDGYALRLEIQDLTADALFGAVTSVVHDPKYRRDLRRRQVLLRDERETPLERAVYWTEYVLRHRGAEHLRSPARHLGVLEYYSVDVLGVLLAAACAHLSLTAWLARAAFRYVFALAPHRKAKSD